MVRIRVGTRAPTTDGFVEKISFREVVFQCNVHYPEGTYLYGEVESTFYPRIPIKGRVLEVTLPVEAADSFAANVHRMLVLVKSDEYFRFVEMLGAQRSGDRRRTLRVPAQVDVAFLFDDRVPKAITSNISRNGISIFTSQRFAINDIVTMKMALPGVLDEIVVVGRVVRLKVEGVDSDTVEERRETEQVGDADTEELARQLRSKHRDEEVQKATKFELGVEFVKLLPDARTQFEAFLKKLEEKNQPVKILAGDKRG
jgi:hypothetical protein